MAPTTTSPAEKTYFLWADSRVFQQVEATSPEEAYREARNYPGDFEPCSPGIDNFALLPEVMDLDSGHHFRVRGPEQSPTVINSSPFRELYDGCRLAIVSMKDALDGNNPGWMDDMRADLDFIQKAVAEAEGRG